MTHPTLTQSRLQAGIWQATLAIAGPEAPRLVATHDGQPLPDLRCEPGQAAGLWQISVAVPADILTDGLQTIVLNLADGTCIGSLAIVAGEPLAHDLRAEIALLRSELDLLKSAVRRMYYEK